MKAKSRLLKIFAAAFVALFALCCLAGFAACGDKREHENLTISEDESYDATCGEDGLTVGYCDDCGKKIETVIPATGNHTWDDGVVTKAATVYEDGETTYTCIVCGATKIEAIDKLIESEGLEFELTEDETGYVVTGIGDCEDTNIVIPAEYEGLPVVAIGDYAFFECSALKSVTFGNGSKCESIGESAFEDCYSLRSVDIPDSVTYIGDYAFEDCSLMSIKIPSGVTSISKGTFEGCRLLTSITIPSGVTTIGDDAFESCISLKSVDIPDSVISIGSWAFAACVSLTSITIPDSVTIIDDYVFYDCYSLTSISIPGSVESIGNYVFGDCYSLTSIVIPNSVTSIGDYVFRDCSSLTSIVIPSSVTSIGTGAFYGCTSLTSISIPGSVESIGSSAFRDCTSLTSVYYAGTADEWTALQSNIESGNTALTGATIYYYSEQEPVYTDDNGYWHYVDGEPVVWINQS